MATTTATKKKLSVEECNKIICQPGTIFELEEIEILGVKQKSWKYQNPDYRTFLINSFNKYLDREFINAPTQFGAYDDRESITYREAWRQAHNVAGWLRMQGIGCEDRVGIVAFNTIGWAVSFVAIHLIGAVPVMVNSALQIDSMMHCIKISEPKLILADAVSTDRLYEHREALAKMGRDNVWCYQDVSRLPMGHKMKTLNYGTLTIPDDVLQSVVDGKGLDGLNPDSDASIFFTSGTTGYPKAVLASQRANMHNLTSGLIPPIRTALRQGLPLQAILDVALAPNTEQNVSLLSVPFFHGTGCISWLVKNINDGTKIVLQRRWSVKDAVKLMVDHNVNTIGGVPAIATAIIQSGLLPKGHKLRAAAYGGAAPQERLAQDVMDRWPDAIPSHGWGMTELTVLHCGNVGIDYVEKPKSCGPPVPVCQIRIIDPETKKECPPFVVGAIQGKGPNTMKCYIGNEKATKETLAADGWLDTGDAGYLDDEGFLYISDRIKDIIIRGGENIASEEVENAIYRDNRMAEVASVPVPHDVLGELVAVAVSLVPGAKATPDEIIEFATSRLRRDARPVFVWISDKPLPRNVNGKLVKAEIKKIVQEKYKVHLARQSKL